MSCSMLPVVRQLPAGKPAGLASRLSAFSTSSAVTSQFLSLLCSCLPSTAKAHPVRNCTSLDNLLKQQISNLPDLKPKFTLGSSHSLG